MLKYRNGYYVVSTFHQLKEFDPQYIGVRKGVTANYVTGGAMYWDQLVSQVDADDRSDIAILDYTESVRSGLIANI